MDQRQLKLRIWSGLMAAISSLTLILTIAIVSLINSQNESYYRIDGSEFTFMNIPYSGLGFIAGLIGIRLSYFNHDKQTNCVRTAFNTLCVITMLGTLIGFGFICWLAIKNTEWIAIAGLLAIEAFLLIILSIISIIACKVKFEQDFKANNGMVYAAPPNDISVAAPQMLHPDLWIQEVQTASQPATVDQTSQSTPAAQDVQPVTVAQAVQPTRVKQPRTVEQASQPTTKAHDLQQVTVAQVEVQPTRVEQPMKMDQTSKPTTVAQDLQQVTVAQVEVQPTEQPTRVEQPMIMEQTSKSTTVAQAVQPTTMTMAPMGSQLIQMPNGQLFMLPLNSYSVAQPVVLQALQVVRPLGTNN